MRSFHQHWPNRDGHLHLYPPHAGSYSGFQRDKSRRHGRCGMGRSCDDGGWGAALWDCGQTGNGCHSSSSHLCGSCDTTPSCTLDGGREHGVRGGRGQTGSARHTCRNHHLSNWCRAPSCSGLNRPRGSGVVRTLSQGAGLRPTIRCFHHSHRQIPPQTACCPVAQVKAEASLRYWSENKEVSVSNIYQFCLVFDVFQCIAPNHKTPQGA